MFYDFDWPAAERVLTRAIELSPNLADAHDYYAMYLAAVGRHAEAADASRRARELNPLSVLILADAGWVHYLAKNYDQMVEMNQLAVDLDPNFWLALVGLGLGYENQGKFPEAIATLEKARAADPNPAILEMLAGAYAASGRKDKAGKLLAEMTARATTQYVCPYEVATVHATLGDKKSTLEWLQKGYDERADCMPWVLSDSKLEELRGYPGFDDLIRRMRFPR
jgi:adenylate cyclase